MKSHISLPQIEAFNDKILTTATAHPRSNTLLEAIADKERDFQKIQDLREDGGGNFVRGVAKEMADIFDTAIDTGENIFRSVAGGVLSVVNTTSDAVKDIGDDVASILDFTSGPISGLILYVLNISVIIYLSSNHFKNRQYINRQYAPPPPPPHSRAL